MKYNMTLPKCLLCDKELSLTAMYARGSSICYSCDVKRLAAQVEKLRERLFPPVKS